MKIPYFNLQQRLLIRLDTIHGAFMLLELAWLKLCREVEKSAKRSKFLLFIFSVVKAKLTFYCQREIEYKSKCNEQCDHCKEYFKPLERQ